jgi:Myb-like DNA-binding domain
LLTKWSESILDIPQLVRLHYGGVTSAVLDNDQNEDDDVSSFGAANNNDDNREEDDDLDNDDDNDDYDDALQTQPDYQVAIEMDRGPNGIRYRKQPAKAPRQRPRQQQQQQRLQGDELDEDNPLQTQPILTQPTTEETTATKATTSNATSVKMLGAAAQHDDDDDATQDPDADDGGNRGGEYALSVRQQQHQRQAEHRKESSNRNGKNSRKSTGKRNRAASAGAEDALWKDSGDDEDHEQYPKRRKNLEWTDAEAKAVKEGYARFGPKWRLIRDNCNNQLSRRSNVQIKDKWRTMQKQVQRHKR